MTERLPYGELEITFDVSPDKVIFKGDMTKITPLKDLQKEFLMKLNHPIGTPPLCSLIRGKKNIVILIEDNTRNTPLKEILPVLLNYLLNHGQKKENISFLTAPGTHRRMTDEEILKKVGPEIVSNYSIYQHDATRPEEMVMLEPASIEGYEIPIEVNKKAIEADFLIGTGNIVPHSDAGFSGGGKIVQPGICGFSSTSATHASSALSGTIPLGMMDNPCRKGIEEVARKVGLSFIVNTVKSNDDAVIAIVTGDLVKAHREGAKIAQKAFSVAIPELADILVISSSPCDIDYWQANKAISTSYFAVKKGGIVIFVSPCTEGLAFNHPKFRDWLSMPLNKIISSIKETNPNDKEADLISAVLAACNSRVREKVSSIFSLTKGLTKEDLLALGYENFNTLEEALKEARRRIPDGKIGIISKGGIALPVKK